MFKKDENDNRVDPKKVETIIGPSIKVKGNFKGQGNTVIEGMLEGSLKTDADVYVGDNAQIFANIESKTARVGGEVRGNIKTEKHLQIVASAKIIGDIYCSSLSVESGATINGQCIMGQNKNTKEDKKNAVSKEQSPETRE